MQIKKWTKGILIAVVTVFSICTASSCGSSSDDPTDLFLCALFFGIGGNMDTGLLGGSLGRGFRTTDAGESFTDVTIDATDYNITGLSFPNNGTMGFASGNMGYVGFSLDAGLTWEKQDLTTEEDVMDIECPVDEDNCFAITKGGIFLKYSSNNWTEIETSLTIDFNGLCFPDNDNGRIVGNGGYAETTDGGLTWGPLVTESTDSDGDTVDFANSNIMDCHWAPLASGLGTMVGSNGTFYGTENNGNTWDMIDTGTTETLNSVKFNTDLSVGLIGGNNGTLLRSLSLGQLWDPLTLGGFSGNIKRVQLIDTFAVAVGSDPDDIVGCEDLDQIDPPEGSFCLSLKFQF